MLRVFTLKCYLYQRLELKHTHLNVYSVQLTPLYLSILLYIMLFLQVD